VIGEIDAARSAQGRAASSSARGKVYYDLLRRRGASVSRGRRPSSASSSCIRSRTRRFAAELAQVPERHRGGLVPGRAAEPGRLVPACGITCWRHAGRSRTLAYAGRAASALAGGRLLDKHYEQQKALLNAARGSHGVAESAPRQADVGAAQRPRCASGCRASLRCRPTLDNGNEESNGIDRSQGPAAVRVRCRSDAAVNWHKKVGEAVARDENLIDVETDKVVLELPAPDGRRAGSRSSRATAARWSPAR
jgi:hypothetical protein